MSCTVSYAAPTAADSGAVSAVMIRHDCVVILVTIAMTCSAIALDLGDEHAGVAAGATTETVERAPARVDPEGGGAAEWTYPAQAVLTHRAKHCVPAHHAHDEARIQWFLGCCACGSMGRR